MVWEFSRLVVLLKSSSTGAMYYTQTKYFRNQSSSLHYKCLLLDLHGNSIGNMSLECTYFTGFH